MKKQCLILLLSLTSLYLSGCKTPKVEETEEFSDSNTILPLVQYQQSELFEPNKVECIAVGEITDETENSDFKTLEKQKLVRRAVYGVLSAKNYRDIELSRVDFLSEDTDEKLLQKLDCDALLTGKIISFENSFLVAYSITTVEIELSLVDVSGALLWKGRHSANSHEGALPLSPISLISGIFVATTNQADEVGLQMIDSAVRRIVQTLPDRDELPITTAFVPEPIIDTYTSETTPNSEMELGQGNYEEALLAAQNELKLDSDNINSLLIASRASLLLGHFEDAERFAMDAVVIDDQNRQALSHLGAAYIKTGRLVLAEGAFIKITRAGKADSLDWYYLGLVQLSRADIPSASLSLLKAGEMGLESGRYEITYKSLKHLNKLKIQSSFARKNHSILTESVNEFLN